MARARTRSERTAAAGPSQRQLRVGEALRHELAAVLNRGELHDPDLAGRSITVTEVRVSPDLRNATAFVLPLGGEAAAPIVAALNRAAPHLRGHLGRALRLKYAPALRFATDDSFEHVARIQQLLSSLPENERAGAGDGSGDEGDEDGEER